MRVTSNSSPGTAGWAEPSRKPLFGEETTISWNYYGRRVGGYTAILYSSPRTSSPSGISNSPLLAILTCFVGLSPACLGTFWILSTIS